MVSNQLENSDIASSAGRENFPFVRPIPVDHLKMDSIAELC
jgi:hypothetical protein